MLGELLTAAFVAALGLCLGAWLGFSFGGASLVGVVLACASLAADLCWE